MSAIVRRMEVRSAQISTGGQRYTVGEAVNIGWEVYGDMSTRIQFNFNDFYTRDQIINAFPQSWRDVYLNEQSSNTNTGLRALREQLFQLGRGDRRGNSNEAIIIVRDNDIVNELRDGNRLRDIQSRIRDLRSRGIATIVIADGNADRNLLRNLVTAQQDQDRYIFTANSFNQIADNPATINRIVEAVCPTDVSGNYHTCFCTCIFVQFTSVPLY